MVVVGLDVDNTGEAGDVLLDIVIFTRLTHSTSYRQHHRVALQDGLGHGVGDGAHGDLVVSVRLSEDVLVVTAVWWRDPAVQ